MDKLIKGAHMIRVNEEGLSPSERLSVRQPLAENEGDELGIDSLGNALTVVLKEYEDVFNRAIDKINTGPKQAD